MDYQSTKYAFGELSEHINKLESKFHISSNLCAKEAFVDSVKPSESSILSLNQKGFGKNGFNFSESQNTNVNFERVASFNKCDSLKPDTIERMRPQEETNYIVKLEKMSAEEMLCNKKTSDTKDKKTSGENLTQSSSLCAPMFNRTPRIPNWGVRIIFLLCTKRHVISACKNRLIDSVLTSSQNLCFEKEKLEKCHNLSSEYSNTKKGLQTKDVCIWTILVLTLVTKNTNIAELNEMYQHYQQHRLIYVIFPIKESLNIPGHCLPFKIQFEIKVVTLFSCALLSQTRPLCSREK